MDINIDREKLKEGIGELKKHNMGLSEIINPIIIKYPSLKEKEIMELCQIGKFLYNIDPNSRILEKSFPPSTDFIINIDGKKVGLEHTRVMDADSFKVRNYQSIVNLIEYRAATKFRKEYPDKLFQVNFFLKKDTLNIKANEKGILVDQINNYLIDIINLGTSNKPDFIESVEIMRHSQLSFSFIENNHEGGKLSFDRLEKEVRKKEGKLTGYKSKVSLDEYWLVLMVGSLNSVSLKIDESVNYQIQSTFDRVYIKSDFDDKIIKVYG